MIDAVAHTLRVVPVRLRVRSDELAVDAVRGVGFRWVCSCGERGRVETTVAIARVAGREHRSVADQGNSG